MEFQLTILFYPTDTASNMPSFKNAVFSLLAAAAVASASDVAQLKKDDFDEFIKSNDIVLAECTY